MYTKYPLTNNIKSQKENFINNNRNFPTSFEKKSSWAKNSKNQNLYSILFISVICLTFIIQPNRAALLQGCNFGEELCDTDEVCLPDGLFGQCYSDAESEILRPLILEKPLNAIQSELLRLELNRLANNGLDWPHARSQCVFAYFKLSILYSLDYDTEFCSVRNPNNIWSLVQRVQNVLLAEKEANRQIVKNGLVEMDPQDTNIDNGQNLEEKSLPESVDKLNEPSSAIVVPIVIVNNDGEEPEGAAEVPYPSFYDLVEEARPQALSPAALAEPVSDIVNDSTVESEALSNSEAMNFANAQENNQVFKGVLQRLRVNRPSLESQQKQDKRTTTNVENKVKLSSDEEKELANYVTDILNNRNPNVKALKSNQLNKLVAFMGSLQNALKYNPLENNDEESSAPELEEVIPLTSVNNAQQLMLKKDSEKFNNADMGLANTVHKIVKGGIQRVEGNRVYLKVASQNLTENELYKLIAYLDEKIAEPNHLYFDEFLYENGQLSFRILRINFLENKQKKNDKSAEKELDNASGVAQAVYKRRKDIQTLAGVEVDETGIGSGIYVVPVESAERDWLFAPILAVCALTIVSLLSILAVHVLRIRRRSKKEQNLPSVIDHFEGKVGTVYEDLCRQRMNTQEVPMAVGAATSKHSSTSSWPDENLLQSSNLDISTGHVILSFLKDCLAKPDEISHQWCALAKYTNQNADTQIGSSEQNINKNYDPKIIPYDESIVSIYSKDSENESSISNYINASKIHDDDPRQVAYIATQAPLQNTVVDFWKMVWEQGIALIVNLCDQDDQKTQKYMKYWPEEGSKVYGNFEIYLVSEHIWSEDYVVRSLYLKNTKTNETRTVTQFHYLTWPDAKCPSSIKSLLEFRRKVNKSYRGNASPILIHCTNGAGRTGTYCLIDITTNRILKGVKELNIAGSLEYLRDQRMEMVENEQQYKMVFNCVAEEVSSLLKNLQH